MARRDEWRVFVGHDRRAVKLSDGEAGFVIDFFREKKVLTLDGVDWRPGKPTFSGWLDGTANPDRNPLAERSSATSVVH